MAVIAYAGQDLPSLYGKAGLITWSALATNDTGTPIQAAGLSERSFQVAGTFGGATVVLQGSNDGTNWVTLTDPLGVAISFTSTGLKQVMQVCRYMRPSVSGGAGVAIDCYLVTVGRF